MKAAFSLVLICTPCALAQNFSGTGFLPGANASWARSLSDQGNTVVGNGPTGCWRWTAAAGIAPIGQLSGYPDQAAATGVSADGATVTGWFQNSQNGNTLPFR